MNDRQEFFDAALLLYSKRFEPFAAAHRAEALLIERDLAIDRLGLSAEPAEDLEALPLQSQELDRNRTPLGPLDEIGRR